MARPDPRLAEGTRRLFLACGIVAAILFVGIAVWPLLTANQLGTAPGRVNPAKRGVTVGSVPAQKSGESKVGKNNPAGQADASGGRARKIEQSARTLQLDQQQHRQVHDIIAHQANPPRVAQPDFDLMIGAAVPQQVQLQNLPPEITQVMNGYWGDQYLLVHDTMVIVDQYSRRVVAIVPNVA